jgi:hypothetical protein
MKKNVILLGLVAAVMLPSAARAEHPHIKRLVVLDMNATGVDPTLARNLSEVMLGSIREGAPQAVIVGQGEINSMLRLEKQKDIMGCDEMSCLAEIGGALGADHLMTASVGRVGTLYIVNLRLINTKQARVLRHLSERVKGEAEQLVEAVSQMGKHLVDDHQPMGIGFVNIEASGTVSVDGHPAGIAPMKRLDLVKGMHHIIVTDSKGKMKLSQKVEVLPYTTVLVSETGGVGMNIMQPEAEGGSKWWLWTIAGVVVAGGATALALSLGGDDPKTDSNTDDVSGNLTVNLNR